jgi:16S rRNA (guanine527-N7)-methyltransferase
VGGSPREILKSGAKELGIYLDELQLDAFDTFTKLLLEWNARFNLTRITDPSEIAVKHFLDSLSLLKFVDVPVGSSVVDIGTGAGLPGVPLKIVRPDLDVTLLDSVRKKLTFVQALVSELKLSGVELVHGRAEDVGRAPAYREQFDFAVSRAVAKLNVLSELCIPFCRVGGSFVAYKGADVEEEIAAAERAISLLGGRIGAVHEFTLPCSDAQRSLIVVEKVRRTPNKYPRKAGTPEREPL